MKKEKLLLANEKFSQFTPASALSGSDKLAGLQSGQNVIATLDQVSAFVSLNVTFQVAYTGGADFTIIDGKPFNATDQHGTISLNVDSGSKKIYSDYNAEIRGGVTSHLINQTITADHAVSQNILDRVNINFNNADYLYTLPLDDTFPDGSQFELMQFASPGSISLYTPPGVYVNGITDFTLTLNTPFQRAGFRRIQQNQWSAFIIEQTSKAENVFTPSLTSISGITTITAINGMFNGNSIAKGSIITAAIEFLIEPNGSGQNCVFKTTPPIPSNFGTALDAISCGEASIRPDTPDGTTGNIGSGALKTLFAAGPNVVQIEIEFAQSIPYKINLAYKWVVK